jgi:hypothetical protein
MECGGQCSCHTGFIRVQLDDCRKMTKDHPRVCAVNRARFIFNGRRRSRGGDRASLNDRNISRRVARQCSIEPWIIRDLDLAPEWTKAGSLIKRQRRMVWRLEREQAPEVRSSPDG